jgi:FADH2 O2-dependent halogenase
MSFHAFDIAIVGSGFGGSLMAMIARRLGWSVVLLERGQHPRFVIGESSTPLANWLLEGLSERYDLPRVRPLAKWGTWQRNYPQIGCGLKRGFSFFHHQFGCPFDHDPEHRNQLLVGASPRDDVADTHWYRPEFDHFLVREAQAVGVEYLDEVRLQKPSFTGDTVQLEAERHGQTFPIRTKFLIDASGPRGFLSRTLDLPGLVFEHLPETQALFTHFRDVRRLADMEVSFPGQEAPFPIDDAALHHVFEGGWIWVLRFNNGLTSAGLAAREELAIELALDRGAEAWAELMRRLPTVADQFRNATTERPWVHQPRLSYRTGRVAGERWALLPSAAGFVDPLLSTGFTLNLLGVSRLARALNECRDQAALTERLRVYSHQTTQELLATERIVGALYAAMGDFPIFAKLASLYFAAVSYAEIGSRRGEPGLLSAFLLHDRPGFGAEAKRCCEDALRLLTFGPASPARRAELIKRIEATIAPIDRIGLNDPARRNWHPCPEDNDVLRGPGPCPRFDL